MSTPFTPVRPRFKMNNRISPAPTRRDSHLFRSSRSSDQPSNVTVAEIAVSPGFVGRRSSGEDRGSVSLQNGPHLHHPANPVEPSLMSCIFEDDEDKWSIAPDIIDATQKYIYDHPIADKTGELL